MKTIWARVGMSVSVSDEEWNELKEITNSDNDEDYDKAAKIISGLFKERGELDGGSYLPGNNISCSENPNDDDFEFMV